MPLSLCAQISLVGQEKAASIQQAGDSVPFVGCKSDGQVGPQDAPIGTAISMPITTKAAQMLAYYRTAEGVSVLAPRGWYCFGTYGSGGSALMASPQPIDTAN